MALQPTCQTRGIQRGEMETSDFNLSGCLCGSWRTQSSWRCCNSRSTWGGSASPSVKRWGSQNLCYSLLLNFLFCSFVLFVTFCLFCFLSLDRPCTTVKRCGKTKNYRRLASWSMSRKSYQRYPKYSQEMFAMLIKKCLNVIFRSEPCRTSLVTSLSTTRWAYSKWPSYKAWAWAWCNWEITGNKPFLTSRDLKMRLPKTLKNIDGRTVRRIMRENLDRSASVAPVKAFLTEAMKCGRVD